MAYTKQVKAASILNNGFDSDFTGGDGVELFSTAHPLVSGGTNQNEPTTAADLNETSLENAVITIGGWTDERGLLTTDVPNGLKHFVRTPMQTSMDGDFDTGNARYKARERYSFGWSDPLGMFGSPGAA